MSDWKIVVPEATTNKTLNPRAGATGNFAAMGGSTVTRSDTYAKYGQYSYRVQSSADNHGMSLTLSTLANAIHYVTFLIRGTLPASWDISLDNSTYTVSTLIESLDTNWSRYGLQIPAAQANGSTTLHIRQDGAGSGDFYIDGVQIEEKEHWTTYCDGGRDGCEWRGTSHASISQRSGQSRAGGRVYDLEDDYSLSIEQMVGTGVSPITLGISEYSILPGGELGNIKAHPRSFTLIGVLEGITWSNLHSLKSNLLSVLARDAVAKDVNGYQPVRLWYTGANVTKEVAAHYEDGLYGDIVAKNYGWERVAIRFLANDPFWYAIGENSETLVAFNQPATSMQHIAGRLRDMKSYGTDTPWYYLNVSTAPAAGYPRCITIGPDKNIYIGGSFTDWDGVSGRSYVAIYDPIADSWATLGNTNDFNGEVFSLVFGLDGTLYAGGNFTNAGADANADYIAKWNGTAWSAVSGGGSGEVRALVIDQDGILYIGGNFTNWNAIANADYIVQWDGSSYTALGTGMNSWINSLAISPDGILYAGGAFSVAGGSSIYRIASWDGSTWGALGTGMNDTVRAIIIDVDGTLYAGGDFSTSGGSTTNGIAVWNGTFWADLDTGVSGTFPYVYSLGLAPDGILYISGKYSYVGSTAIAWDRNPFRWNGHTWSRVDVDFPGTAATCYAFVIGNIDPTVPANYDMYTCGSGMNGGPTLPVATTVNNAGTESAYPQIVVALDDTAITAIIIQIRNETTGKALIFDYTMQAGEKVTIDLRPKNKSIISNFYGPIPKALIAGSNFGTFALQPGDNVITNLLAPSAGTILAETNMYIIWQEVYSSQD